MYNKTIWAMSSCIKNIPCDSVYKNVIMLHTQYVSSVYSVQVFKTWVGEGRVGDGRGGCKVITGGENTREPKKKIHGNQ